MLPFAKCAYYLKHDYIVPQMLPPEKLIQHSNHKMCFTRAPCVFIWEFVWCMVCVGVCYVYASLLTGYIEMWYCIHTRFNKINKGIPQLITQAYIEVKENYTGLNRTLKMVMKRICMMDRSLLKCIPSAFIKFVK